MIVQEADELSHPVGLVNCSMCMPAQSLSHVRLFATPWTVALQAPLSMEYLQHMLT